MVVSKTVYGSVIVLTGTLGEVAQQIADDQVPELKFKIFYNGTNISAIYKMK